jgi:hypothetical protein
MTRSIEERRLKPSPAIPWAPYPNAGFLTSSASRKAWLGTAMLE